MTTTATKTRTKKSALEPLDFSEYVEPPSDNPELDAFKAKVIEEARKHSRNHHCGEYKSVLRALGISEKSVSEVKVSLETVTGFTFAVNVKPEEFAGKTSDEQATALAAKLGDVKVSAGSGVTGTLKIKPESIVSWSLPEKKAAPVPGTDDAPEGYSWRYISSEGLVRHLVRMSHLVNSSGTYRTACSRTVYRSWMPAEGMTPTRGTGGNCTKCMRSSAAMTS
jgi:hypothetical protein